MPSTGLPILVFNHTEVYEKHECTLWGIGKDGICVRNKLKIVRNKLKIFHKVINKNDPFWYEKKVVNCDCELCKNYVVSHVIKLNVLV